MKTCPVCHSKAFDDALVCYGCLYRFDEQVAEEGILAVSEEPLAADKGSLAAGGTPLATGEAPLVTGEAPFVVDGGPLVIDEGAAEDKVLRSETMPSAASAGMPQAGSVPADTLPGSSAPAFFIRMTPMHTQSGKVTWSCAVELAPC